MLALLIVVLAIGATVAFIISWAQLASFYINYTGFGTSGNPDYSFWNTGNFWAWVVTFLLFMLVIFVLKLIAVGINRLILIISYFLGSRSPYKAYNRVQLTGLFIMVLWFAFSIWAANALFQFLASYPGFTEWFTPDNWFAGVLLGISIFSITARFKMSDDDD